MILKGNQRGGGADLATHLLNEFENGHVQVAEVRGAVVQDLHGAFAEWEAIAKATRCQRYLYSLSINPDPRQPWRHEDYRELADRIEQNTGMVGQPRAIVLQVKDGRPHCHVVWSRIDSERMRAIQLSYDRNILKRTAQEFARERGLTLPKGMQKDAANDWRGDKKYGEKQQEERTGITKDERRQAITALWKAADDGRAFAEALELNGYYLARGDKVAYVVVDLYGEVHSLPRQIEGVRTKQVVERLASIPPGQLRTIEQAQEHAARQRALRAEQREQSPAPAKAGLTSAERTAALQEAHAKRRAPVDAQLKATILRQTGEQEALRLMQEAENTGIVHARLAKQPTGLTAFIVRITGIGKLIDRSRRRADEQRAAQHREQDAALARRHDRERQDIKAQYRALARVEKRELRSLKTLLHREEFQAIARDMRQAARAVEKPAVRLTPPQQAHVDTFRENARDMARPNEPPSVQGDDTRKPRGKGPLSRLFDRVAERFTGVRETTTDGGGPGRADPRRGDDTLTPRFADAASSGPSPVRPPAAQDTGRGDDDDSLTAAFERRADQKAEQQRDAERGPGRSRGGPEDVGKTRGR